MLSWSRELKRELTGVDEMSDEEAAEREIPQEAIVGRIEADGLAVLQSRRLLAHFLEFVREHCGDPDTAQGHIDEYLAIAPKIIPRAARGEVKIKMHSRGFMYVDAEAAA